MVARRLPLFIDWLPIKLPSAIPCRSPVVPPSPCPWLLLRFLAIASTLGAGLTERDIRRTTKIVRQLSSDVKARSERLSSSL
jgi:hypothetical protein